MLLVIYTELSDMQLSDEYWNSIVYELTYDGTSLPFKESLLTSIFHRITHMFIVMNLVIFFLE